MKEGLMYRPASNNGQPGPGQPGPKSKISYHLGQAILALGKDDFERVWDNINKATNALTDYEAERAVRRENEKATGTIHKPQSSR